MEVLLDMVFEVGLGFAEGVECKLPWKIVSAELSLMSGEITSGRGLVEVSGLGMPSHCDALVSREKVTPPAAPAPPVAAAPLVALF